MGFRKLLEHAERGDSQWQDWQIRRIDGGANNLLYRATSPHDDLAIKFTIRDERRRARREFEALSAIKQAGLAISPEPVLLDEDHYHNPVIVQRWLEGDVLTTPPQDDATWSGLIQHYATIHTITPTTTSTVQSEAFINATSGATGRALVQQQIDWLPTTARPVSLIHLLEQFAQWEAPEWPTPPRTLCRVDSNCPNFLRGSDGWASVDWENSGWGDPAFEIAEMMAHPAYQTVPHTRWEWVIETYVQYTQDPSARTRIQAYYTIMQVWWVVRFARYLYEIPQGLDPRLVDRSPTWQTEMEEKYQNYLEQACQLLSSPMR